MLDFEQRAGNGPSSTEINGSFATHLDRVRILCGGGDLSARPWMPSHAGAEGSC